MAASLAFFMLVATRWEGGSEVLCLCRSPTRPFVSNGAPLDPSALIIVLNDSGEIVADGQLLLGIDDERILNLVPFVREQRARDRWLVEEGLRDAPSLSTARVVLDISAHASMRRVNELLRATKEIGATQLDLVVERSVVN